MTRKEVIKNRVREFNNMYVEDLQYCYYNSYENDEGEYEQIESVYVDALSEANLESQIPIDLEERLLSSRIDKEILSFVKRKLDQELGYNQRFDDNKLEWPPLRKILAVARLKELAAVKIIRKGGRTGLRYDLADLKASYYGKKIMKSLNFGRRHIVNRHEFQQVNESCKKLKLNLPESIEPTITEIFFDSKRESVDE